MEQNGFKLFASDFNIKKPEGFYGNVLFVK
jgi:hypothetical protein